MPLIFFTFEIDVDSYFFHNSLEVYIVNNRVIRLSKCLFRQKILRKDPNFEPIMEYQSFKLTAQLNVTRKEILFTLENLKLINKSCNSISKTLFIPNPVLKFCQNSPSKVIFFLHFSKDFQKFSKSCVISFDIGFFRDLLKKTHQLRAIFSNLHQYQKFDYLLKIHNFSLIIHKNFN